MNALLWIYYSIIVEAYPLLCINVIGAVLRIAYILIFVRYEDQNRKRHVIRTRSVEFMPLPLSLFLTSRAATWTLYGVVLGDIHIIIVSTVGFVLGVVQVMLYMIFRNPPRSE